ncbi:unnamed protein product [Mytilus coruscus]|uniref:Ig-like domain-containing protein n=1 Tax=Mytilus coruscus TaxID=42192 RepID=A0A6J8B1S5_MYTCO|nr:unnamed protein product [Mytilus coruscus]
MMKRLRTSKRCVLLILVFLSLTAISFGQSPGTPIITGRNLTFQGHNGSLTCTSVGGKPAPTVKWYRNITMIDDTMDTTTVPNITRNTYSYTADISYHLAVFECRVENGVLESYLSATIFLHVYKEPDQPTLTATSPTVTSGTKHNWTCISTGGNPQPKMTMRIGNSQFSTGIEQTSEQQSDNTLTVTVVLSWAPTIAYNGLTLYCDVKHKETRGEDVQTASLQLIVIGSIPVVTVSQSTYSGTTGQSVTLQCFLTVTIPQSSYSVLIGQQLTLPCTVTGTPTQTNVFWMKVVNGVQTNVVINGNSRYTGGTTATPSLTITNAQSSDEGTYVCHATNIVGTSNSQNTFLDVIGGVPNVTIGGSSFQVQVVGTGQSRQQIYVDVIGNPPEISIQFNSYSVLLGQTVTLVCTISANPSAISVRWYKVINGVQTSLSTTAGKYNMPTVSSPNLIINSAAQSDTGYYVCTATNIVGTGASSQTYLTVTGNLPAVTVTLSNYNTNIGGTVILGCTVDATPAATNVYWQRIVNNQQQNIDTTSSNSQYSGSTVSNPSLVITNAQSLDEGNYICYATNSIGTGNSQQTYLNVLGNVIGSIPTVIIGSDYYPVNYGNTATIECNVVATPTETSISWQKIQNSIPSTVVISGRYQGGTGQSSQTYLDVQGAAPSVQVLSNYYSVVIGLSVTLQCIVTSNPAHTNVTWNKIENGQQTNIGSNNRYSGGSTNTTSLTISNAVDSDEGYYICTAVNAVGEAIPVVTIVQSQYNVNVGSSVTMVCTVSANPVHTSVYWQKDVNGVATNINLSQTSKYSGSTTTSPSLTVLNAVIADQGYYTCNAQNSVGTGTSSQTFLGVLGSVPVANYVCKVINSIGTGISSPTFLDVLGNIPVITTPTSAYTVIIGGSVTITCTVTANPQHTSVYWQYISSSSSSNVNIGGRAYGTSRVSASSAGGVEQAQLFDCVPSVSLTRTSFTGNYGDTITLGCTVSANPSATSVYWQKVSGSTTSTVDVSNSRYTGSSVSTPSLTINNLNSNDAGNYICLAANSVGTGQSIQGPLTVIGDVPVVTVRQSAYSSNIGNTITLAEGTGTSNNVYLTVTGDAPTSIAISPSPISVNEDQTITANCTVQGSPTITYTWFKGNSTTQFSDGYILQIPSSKRTDAGTYQCRASNTYGNANATVSVEVKYIPDVTITQPSQGIRGQAVTIQCSYVSHPTATNLIWSKGNQGITVDGNKYVGGSLSNPDLTITNLGASDRASYKCSVVNSLGQGDSSSVTLSVDLSGK